MLLYSYLKLLSVITLLKASGRSIEVKTIDDTSSGNPKGGHGCLIRVLFTIISCQYFQDFDNWPLTGGWLLNGWPLNTGSNVKH